MSNGLNGLEVSEWDMIYVLDENRQYRKMFTLGYTCEMSRESTNSLN